MGVPVDSVIRTLSRTDHAFTNVPMAEARDFRFQVQVVGDLGDASVPGDHLPIRIPFQKATLAAVDATKCCPQQSGVGLDRRILYSVLEIWQHKESIIRFNVRLVKLTEYGATPWVFGDPRPDDSCERTATGTSLRPLGAVRLRSQELVGQCFDNATFACTNFPAVAQIAASFTRRSIADREDAIGHLPWSQTEKGMALTLCSRSRHAWSAKKPTLILHAVVDEEVRHLEDAYEAGCRLCRHWVGIFREREEHVEDRSRAHILQHV